MIVIGAGVVGCSVAWHLAELGAKRVLVLERAQIGAGTTAMSSGILRTHYSVPENVELARRSWQVFDRFADYLGDDDASAGLVKCGYLIAAPEGPRLEALRASLQAQQAMGIELQLLDADAAAARLPICRFDDAALIGFEPQAGFADAYLVTTGFARAARRRGVKFLEGVPATRLLLQHGRVAGVDTVAGPLPRAGGGQRPEHLGHRDRRLDRHRHAGEVPNATPCWLSRALWPTATRCLSTRTWGRAA